RATLHLNVVFGHGAVEIAGFRQVARNEHMTWQLPVFIEFIGNPFGEPSCALGSEVEAVGEFFAVLGFGGPHLVQIALLAAITTQRGVASRVEEVQYFTFNGNGVGHGSVVYGLQQLGKLAVVFTDLYGQYALCRCRNDLYRW